MQQEIFIKLHYVSNSYIFLNVLLFTWFYLPFLQPHRSDRPVNMENLPVNNNNGQSYGYTLYETTITGGGTLNSRNNIRDRAVVRAYQW